MTPDLRKRLADKWKKHAEKNREKRYREAIELEKKVNKANKDKLVVSYPGQVFPYRKPFEIYPNHRIHFDIVSGRRLVSLSGVSGIKPLGMFYSRYLMCLICERRLKRNEEVDHIYADCKNNNPSNLQILSTYEHRIKTVKDATLKRENQRKQNLSDYIQRVCEAYAKNRDH